VALEEIGTASTGGTSTSNIALTHGLTIASGDVLIAFTHNDVYNVTQTDNNGSTPFTRSHDVVIPTDASHGYVWERVAGASEPSTYNWTMSAAPSFSIVLRQFRGVDTVNIWDVAPSGATTATGTSSNSPLAPDITITNAGAMGLLAIYVDSSSATMSNPTNSYTDEVENGQRALASYRRAGLSAGAVGTAGATCSAVDDWAAIHCALKPAAAAATLDRSFLIARGIGIG
jgi:hypothetical protein